MKARDVNVRATRARIRSHETHSSGGMTTAGDRGCRTKVWGNPTLRGGKWEEVAKETKKESSVRSKESQQVSLTF